MRWVQKIAIYALAIVFLAVKANAEDSSHPSGSLQYMEPYAAVEGLSVGAHVTPESEQYKRFSCRPSGQFSSSTWCAFSELNGGITTSRTILHLTDYTITYINKQLSPAFLTNEEVDKEIARLSRQFNSPAHIYRSPQRSSLPSGVIATWGGIKLQPLTPDDLAILAEGASPHRGIMVDFLINFQESAKAGLPVYGLSGGKGYVWIARFDETGKGKLRFFAADPSQMTQIAQQPDYEEHVPPQSAPPVSKQEALKTAEATVKESESRLPPCPNDTSTHWDKCYGSYTWPNGEKYVGEWMDDKINAQGTYTWPDGQKYVGEFRDGKRNGKGTLTPPDAEKYVGEYVGEFKNGKKDGQGSLTWPNGEKYVGGFKDDKRSGQGTLTWPNGDKYVGEFDNDRRNGYGVYTGTNGEKYVGEFKDDLRNGQGSLTGLNGENYVGEFKDDKYIRHGTEAAGSDIFFNSSQFQSPDYHQLTQTTSDSTTHDVGLMALWIAGFAAIYVILLGYRRKVVIYMDSSDLGMNILPLPLLVTGLMIAGSMDNKNAGLVIAVLSVAAMLIVMVYNFYKSLKFNFFLSVPLNVLVAVVKALFSLVSIALALLWLLSLTDERRSLRERAMGGLIVALLAILMGHLVNGKEVYAARGFLEDANQQSE